jgi:hypothetical protein
MKTLDDFAVVVRSFCDWTEADRSTQTGYAVMLLARRHLASLYASAIDLPEIDCEPVDDVLTHEDYKQTYHRFDSLPVGYYGRACDPLDLTSGETSLGDLADDLADIWRDLKEGLLLFDGGHRDAAAASWQESFTIHWGNHAANALAVIQDWLGQNRYANAREA